MDIEKKLERLEEKVEKIREFEQNFATKYLQILGMSFLAGYIGSKKRRRSKKIEDAGFNVILLLLIGFFAQPVIIWQLFDSVDALQWQMFILPLGFSILCLLESLIMLIMANIFCLLFFIIQAIIYKSFHLSDNLISGLQILGIIIFDLAWGAFILFPIFNYNELTRKKAAFEARKGKQIENNIDVMLETEKQIIKKVNSNYKRIDIPTNDTKEPHPVKNDCDIPLDGECYFKDEISYGENKKTSFANLYITNKSINLIGDDEFLKIPINKIIKIYATIDSELCIIRSDRKRYTKISFSHESKCEEFGNTINYFSNNIVYKSIGQTLSNIADVSFRKTATTIVNELISLGFYFLPNKEEYDYCYYDLKGYGAILYQNSIEFNLYGHDIEDVKISSYDEWLKIKGVFVKYAAEIFNV